jgi:hypothetical protein
MAEVRKRYCNRAKEAPSFPTDLTVPHSGSREGRGKWRPLENEKSKVEGGTAVDVVINEATIRQGH